MKLICLNIWGGKIYKPLEKFLKTHSWDTDIFCFQEVLDSSQEGSIEGEKFEGSRPKIYKELQDLLINFKSFYTPFFDLTDFGGEVNFGVPFGQAIFIRNNLRVKKSGDFYAHRKKYNNIAFDEGFPNTPRNVVFVNFEKNGKIYWIFNYHGVWVPGPKVDNDYRINASKKIRRFMDSKKGVKILCGDFNLLPETKSLEILTSEMRDLIKENNIQSTRSIYFNRNMSKYSDYLIVSKDTEIKDFKVLEDAVSDHLPLLMEFE